MATGRPLETDHLVVGAGAMGLAFVDALVEHADVHVALVDRRDGPGGHWRDAYPYVRLHQASPFYGVASTVLGGEVQRDGPEAGLHARAGVGEILDYYDRVLARHVAAGRVTWLPGTEHREDADGHVLVDVASGEVRRLRVRGRVVDAAWLSPTIPATSPPPFHVADDARVVTNTDLVDLSGPAGEVVVVGSGKTATDAIVWLLDRIDPDRVVWIRPRDPWMFDRAAVQPDPVVMTRTAASVMEVAGAAPTPDAMFLGLEEAGVMLRVDRSATPTMAKTPTLARWELDRLRSVERVVRRGHVRSVGRGVLVLEDGELPVGPEAVVVHCAASGTVNRPPVPVWQPDRVRLQTVRSGAPCFNGALLGYLQATRDDDRERNRLAPPNLYGNTLAEWARMQARGTIAGRLHAEVPDVAAWSHSTTLNPGRIPADRRDDPALAREADRLGEHAERGLERLLAFAGPDANGAPGRPGPDAGRAPSRS